MIIDGTLIVRPTKTKINFLIRCKTIWVRSGTLKSDKFNLKPFTGSLTIELTGAFDDSNYVVIDNFVDPTNKALVVTGTLDLKGKDSGNNFTRLVKIGIICFLKNTLTSFIKIALAGDNTI